jgi:hypothetical protein
MHRFTAMVALFLLVCGAASAADTKKTVKTAPAKEEVLKMSADDVFAFVEHVVKDPKADRVEARKFLQAAMNGQVRMLQVGTELGAKTKCYGGIPKCPNGCATCNTSTSKCRCTICCIAEQ